MKSQAVQRLSHRGGKAGGRYYVLSEFRGQFFEPRGMIDGGADDGEVEPILRPDVAVGDFAQM